MRPRGDLLLAHALHAAAWVAVRFTTPMRAHAALKKLGSHVGPLDDARARWLAGALEPWGSCLTRSLALSARLPDAAVALAVVTGEQGGFHHAHAWVECHGRALRPSDVYGEVVAWLQRPGVISSSVGEGELR